MKTQKKYDERIVTERRKIGSDTCNLLMLVLLASILVQQFIYGAPFSQYAVEFICFIGASIYILIRNFLSGNNLFSGKRTFIVQVVINSIVWSLMAALINGVFRYMKYEENFREDLGMFVLTVAITFVSSFILTFTILYILYQINRKRQRQIEKNLNEDDSIDE